MVTMDHSEAIRIGAVERYVLDELTEEQQSQYEKHYFECRECAEDLKSTAIFVANAKKVLAKDTKERVRVRGSERPRPGWLALFWPVPAGALAAVLLVVGVAGYQALSVVPHLRSELAAAEAPQAAPWYFLSVSRSEPQVIEASRKHRMIGLTLSRSSERSFPYYRCEVRDSAGRVVRSFVVSGPPKGGEIEILIPVSRLQPGDYVIVVAGLESWSSGRVQSDPARYPFTLHLGED